METDDIIYLTLLIFTIVFGYFFRRLKDKDSKKWISTAIGFTLVFLVSGIHVFHPIICVVINGSIILFINKRYCHVVSLIFTFLYLIFFRTTVYFGIPYAPNHTNMVQMILTLKIIGLAFEVHDSHNDGKNVKDGRDKSQVEINPGFLDVVHYTFSYIGVLTGPFYTYKTFQDYYERSFEKYAPCESTTLQKLALVPLYAGIFLWTTYHYPIQYVDSEEFYLRPFLYRLFYIVPLFITFRMRIYIGLILSECACTMAGLGAYPVFTKPEPGKGPTQNLDQMQSLQSETSLKKEEYNFETVNNIVTYYTEFDPKVRSSIRYWNMTVQYWMAYIVYKRFPIKAFRVAATFAVSAIWHGIYAGYFLCLGVVPFYLTIEDIWDKLLRKDATGRTRTILDVVFWFVRTQAFSYMAMAFSLLTMERGLRYYASVYYVYHITSVLALGIGMALTQFKQKKLKENR